MNITYLRLKPVLRELRAISTQLERMNNIRETELAHQGLHIRPPLADTSGDEPETLYTDEERDAVRELYEQMGRQPRRASEE